MNELEEKIKSFIDKWNVAFEDREQQMKFNKEMREDILELLTPPKSGKSAEEVLNEKIMFHNKDLPKGFELGPFSHRETNCFIEAMHEFAQQKEPKPLTDAVEFAEWLNKGQWVQDHLLSEGWFSLIESSELENDQLPTFKSIQELYEIFKNKPR